MASERKFFRHKYNVEEGVKSSLILKDEILESDERQIQEYKKAEKPKNYKYSHIYLYQDLEYQLLVNKFKEIARC